MGRAEPGEFEEIARIVRLHGRVVIELGRNVLRSMPPSSCGMGRIALDLIGLAQLAVLPFESPEALTLDCRETELYTLIVLGLPHPVLK